MKIDRFNGKKSNFEPGVHFITREGKRVYRIWNRKNEEYLTKELSEEELKELESCRALTEAIREDTHPQELFFRDLSGTRWWTDNEHPRGFIERHSPTDDFLEAFGERDHEAWRCSNVALMAIKAYRAYVKAGGDPLQLPVMSFAGGQFEVTIEDERNV
ncbi:MAG: hypothetical protein ABIO72_02780 [Patescibacteria group bacterium]